MTNAGYTQSEMVEFTAKVPRQHYTAFVGLFPQYGAAAWFIRTTLEEFLRRVESDPTAIERIRETIETTVKNA